MDHYKWFKENRHFFAVIQKSLKLVIITSTARAMLCTQFLRFLPIFGEKYGVFLNNQWYNQIFVKNVSM
jgi:hypothetical protein